MSFKNLFIVAFVLFVSSCQFEEEPVLEVPEAQGKVLVSCSISGPLFVDPNTTHSYSAIYSSDIQNPRVTWSIPNGGAWFPSGQNGNIVSVTFDGSCSDVVLFYTVRGTKNGIPHTCEESVVIRRCAPPEECDPVWAPISATNMWNGSNATVCPNKHFAVSLPSLSSGYNIEWTIIPAISNTAGSTSSWYVEFTDVSQYSQYTVIANYESLDGTKCGSSNVLITENSSNCGGHAI